MAVNTSTYCAPPLNRFPGRRLPIVFISLASSSRSFCFPGDPTLRIVSVHSQKPGSESSAIILETGGQSRSSSSSTASAIDFLTLCHSLKTTKRKGWINHGIKGPESIADHMYRMALMALIAGDLPGVNREREILCLFRSNFYRCIKIAIVHDIAEAIVGDITPSDGVPKEEKSRREQAALTEMCKILGGGMRAEEIQELWAEYENNASLEANLVKDFDKVEMILQALEYEMEHGKVLDEFFLSTADRNWKELGSRDQFKEKFTIG
ncbi:HD domain-containing protein 2 isoform X2 [Durio zibethinus]|uniref:5'-deoxynucleotidase n=1 Tax=Durio zibethinus TaxID=66656 RepID=A0A6P5Y391_DURZI|nr:HD domain-containing protein 2 isoform X2 [Durio zibethinus]